MTRVVTPFVPGLEIRKQYVRNTDAQIPQLSAYLIGPLADVIRYSVATERERGRLGTYDEDGTLISGTFQTSYAWPSKPVGGVVDGDFARVHVKNALLQYFNQAAGTIEAAGSNKLYHPTVNWTGNGTAYPANAAFGDRGVRIGDRVLVTGTDGVTPFELATYVQGFEGDLSMATNGPAVAANSNRADTVAASATVDGGANTGDVSLVENGLAYDGLAVGKLTETYLISVIQASTGGDATTARLSVSSSSGLDNVPVLTPAAYDVAFAVGNRGLTVTLSDVTPGADLVVGESWTVTVTQDYTAPSLVVSGSYAANDQRDRNYLIEVLQGGDASSSPVVKISTTYGNDAGTVLVLTDGGGGVMNAVSLGSYGLTLQLTLNEGIVTGDRWTVAATAAKATNMRTLVLAHNLPSGVPYDDAATAQLDVTLYVMQDVEMPRRSTTAGQYNFTTSDTELLVRANIYLAIPEWTVSGVETPLKLSHPAAFGANISALYVTSRVWHPKQVSLLSLRDSTELATLPGPIDSDNPLKYALSKALLVNDGRPLYYFNTGNPNSVTGWEAALQAADDTRATYGFVPLTRNATALDLVASHVNSRSGPSFNMYRVAWLSGDDVTAQIVLSDTVGSDDDSTVLATITDDPSTSGTQYTLLSVTSGNAQLVELGVRAGDTVRFGFATDLWGDETYEEYVVDAVINEATLRLVSGPSFEESVARKIEIHRTLTVAERVDAFKGALNSFTLNDADTSSANSVKYDGHLIRYQAFGTVYDGAKEVPSYYLNAVLAAARGAFAPHQPMTRMVVPGFTNIKDVNLFTSDQLNELAASGGWICYYDIQSGSILVRHAVTAGDWDNVNTREESIVSNVDSISFYLFQQLDPYIGKANVVDEVLAMIKAEIEASRSYLQAANASPSLGGQLINLTILDLRPSPAQKDTIILRLELIVPGPVNRIVTDLIIQ